ncbi:hypothetical protein NUU61_000836 [Penicillium alfredii]|uniref:Xylanolytic transcriptional activator regulatory domain-containing protein n=1 Tax=Penicillium alfredii TaxID=1506179 RepID=A0A9W9GAN8_9EURO|nr:uncharacterized protein NUU61_000836 [Penicillium alfredii]KAJ5115077.1 hypothetical protein NUU61_000836 [Penicillium alfredii]
MAAKTLGPTSTFGSRGVQSLAQTDRRSRTFWTPTNELSPGQIDEQNCETYISGSNVPTPNPAIGANSELSNVLRERFFTLLPGENIVRQLGVQIYRGPFTGGIFTELPPKAHLQSLFEVSYDDINCLWPLFNPSILISLLDEHYASDAASAVNSFARWGLLNTATAIAIQSRAAEGSYSEMIDLSWHFFKNSFSVFPAIVSRGSDLLALEALLAMALFMQGSSDLRTTSLLISEAARLSLTLGFHKKSYYLGMDPVIAERQKRAFWIAYILDRDMSIKTGMPSVYKDDDISLEYTNSDSLGCPGDIISSETWLEATVFRLRTELAVIESDIQNRLYSEKSSKRTASQLLQAVVELDYRLEDWKEKVPLNIQPGRIIWSAVTARKEPIILLHYVYYCAMSAVHSFAAHLMPVDDVSLLSQSISSRIIHTNMAQESVRLLQHLPPQAPGYLWQILFYPLSACIALVAILLKYPTDVRARSHLRHIGDFVKFLNKVQQHNVLDVERMLHLCTEFEKLVVDATTMETNVLQSAEFPTTGCSNTCLNANAQRLISQQAFYGHHMHLAQGLMGNMPALQALAANVFFDLLPEQKANSSTGVLAPALLNPETYQFAFTQGFNKH